MRPNKFEKYIINMFVQHYGYSIKEFTSIDKNKEFWGMSKNENGILEQVVFLEEKDFNKLSLDTQNNNIIFTKVLVIKGNEKNSNWHFIAENSRDNLIVLYEKEEKILYYNNSIELLIARINSILQYKKDTSSKKIIDISCKATITLIAINLLMYSITAILSKNIFDSDINVLINLGAKENSLIRAGEYYRLLTSTFLHGGIVHIGLNMYSLFILGPVVEKIYGSIKYIVIYILGGIIASYTSYFLSTSVSIGASGAIFALLGALLVATLKSKNVRRKNMIKDILSVILVNIIIGVSLSNIDNFAHIGGLIGGIITSFIVYREG